MNLEQLSELMQGHQTLRIEATCYDCNADVTFIAKRTSETDITIAGGAALMTPSDWNTEKILFKCEKCFAENPHFNRPTEVYSRVVGYLRPVQNWNPAKRDEFGMRKEYRI